MFTVLGQFHGEAGVYQTVALMRDMVNRSMLHPWIRERAASLITACKRDMKCEDDTITGWVRQNVQFTRDPAGVEALHDPVTFYEARLRSGKLAYGDCDDMSVYLASLLKSVGHHPKFRVIAKNDTFGHVHVICSNNHLDPTFNYGDGPKNPARAIQIDI